MCKLHALRGVFLLHTYNRGDYITGDLVITPNTPLLQDFNYNERLNCNKIPSRDAWVTPEPYLALMYPTNPCLPVSIYRAKIPIGKIKTMYMVWGATHW